VPTPNRSSASGIVLGRVLLRDEQDLLVVAHHRFQARTLFSRPTKSGHDHVREDDDVAQRQHRKQFAPRHFGWFVRHHGPRLRTVDAQAALRTEG
jgi:DNA-binding transcriptional LysR family regulator